MLRLATIARPGRFGRTLSALAAGLALWLAAGPLAAFESHCIAVAGKPPQGVRLIRLASLDGLPPAGTVRITYVSHATFLIETERGQLAATDYTGFVGTNRVPDVVTMNIAHPSHYTDSPDPAIPHVLRGWWQDGRPAEHRLELDGLRVRNVTTDIRDRRGGRIRDANSIFIFEVAGLCIAHLGHLHHEPSEEQYAAIGRMDVVMAPVDGGLTLDHPTMIRLLKRVRASIVLPMHWFGEFTLERFLDGMAGDFRIDRPALSEIEVSLRSLPREPTVVVLRPRFAPPDEF